jgi:hypothetical protein
MHENVLPDHEADSSVSLSKARWRGLSKLLRDLSSNLIPLCPVRAHGREHDTGLGGHAPGWGAGRCNKVACACCRLFLGRGVECRRATLYLFNSPHILLVWVSASVVH